MSSHQMHRGLQNRHLQMIALGGAIGTGLFLGSASAIKIAGPAISLAYLIGGIIVFFLMRMLGEMCVAEPVSGSFSYFANKYWGKYAGFMSGWSYYILYLLASMAELTAVGIYINYWFPNFPQWQSALITLVIITAINLIHVRWFGEVESVMSIVKVVAVISMIFFGLYLIFDHNMSFPENFNNLWIHGGYMPNGITGIASSLAVVMFSFAGIELIGITASEVENPEKNIPTAISQVIYRIMIFYVGAMLVLLALYPWQQIGTNGSPFVLIFEEIGIPAAANLLNIVVLSAAISVYNSAMYSNSRMLFALAKVGSAPKAFMKLSKTHVPYIGIISTSALTLCTVMLNYLIPNEIFDYLLSLTVSTIVISWASIVITHWFFRKKHELKGTADQIKYKSFWYPYTNIICMAFFAYALYTMFNMGGGMRTAVIMIPVWLILLYFGFLATKKSRAEAEANNFYAGQDFPED